ncbi:hypothetical protein PRVXH_000380 [Proteinivorax hydrogeniformans]|uniref:SWIM-type domain-containing protein n=1 Tax=Proteinivorax hydrogeniformans TaxID=1826727 RepID=A0AAU8HUL5_9FIRM
MSRYKGYPKYVSAADKRAKIQKQVEKLKKKNPDIKPIVVEGRNISTTWWGKAWNKNLEIYADYTNRLSRGRSYVRQGAVLDLQIEKGKVNALVQGSGRSPYEVEIFIEPLEDDRWDYIVNSCGQKIDSFEELAKGKFPKQLAEIFTMQDEGLFPAEYEIELHCSCYDWANMCKHVTAVLYGIGAKFDEDPTLFFKLRDINFRLLMSKTIEQKMDSLLKNADKKSKRVIDDQDVSDLFGL